MAADLLAFPFLGGRHALNFAGTLGKRGSGDIERLATPADLARWCSEAGFGSCTAGLADLEAARRLREAIYSLTLATLGRTSAVEEDVAVVNEWAAHETRAPVLTLRAGELHRDDPESPASVVLAAVARDAVDLLTGPEASSIRDCEDPTCTLLFVDTSRSHRRRWCSMTRCGARAKMRTLRSASGADISQAE
jgi:predicted RNA-binding Zn ribbon-like protein